MTCQQPELEIHADFDGVGHTLSDAEIGHGDKAAVARCVDRSGYEPIGSGVRRLGLVVGLGLAFSVAS